jgi:hypothetical protein
MSHPVVWVHGDNLSPKHPALQRYPQAPALWVFDQALLQEAQISFKRIVFLYECLLELPVTLRKGDVVTELLRFVAEHGGDRLVTCASPSPRFAQYRASLERHLPVEVLPDAPFIAYDGPLDLKRFSRYWKVAKPYAFK